MNNLIKLYSNYKPYVKAGTIFSLLIMIYYGILQSLIINVLTIIYLTYKSIHLLENININGELKELNYIELIKRLKQWICYAFFMMLECIGDFIFNYMPFTFFYYLAKMVLFLWIIQSDDNLNKIYSNWVLYYYKKYNIELEKFCDVLEKISINYKYKIDMYIKSNYVYIKQAIFNYLDDVIKEKIK